MILDTDHWFLGGDGHGYPSDSLTYSWTASAGTPGTSTTPLFTWTAPPCIGPVTITLTVDDVPDSMDNPCPGSARNDSSEDFQGTSTVSLPTGCSTGTKGAIFELTKTTMSSSTCKEKEGYCGLMDNPENFSHTVNARYDQCKWVFDVESSAEAPTGACPSNYINVEYGSEAGITEDNYDIIVYGFRNLDGCIGIGDDVFSNTVCMTMHEDNHFAQFEEELELQRVEFLTKPSMNDMTIDCGDTNTTTCQAAVAERQQDIIADVLIAYGTAYANAQDEDEAAEAARECFEGIADIVEAYWE